MRVRAAVPNALPVSNSTAANNVQTTPHRTRKRRSCLCLPFTSFSSSSSSSRSSRRLSSSHQTQGNPTTTVAMDPIPSSSAATTVVAPPPATSTSNCFHATNSATPTIKTRILIISDTHGIKPTETLPPQTETTSSPCTLYGHTASRSAFHYPLPAADVIIHCGDLTKRSSADEYRSTISMLRQIDAPVKIAIAGNHDLSLHKEFIQENIDDVPKDQPNFVWLARQVASHAEAKSIVAEHKGITYLEEGTQEIMLPNGAKLRLYTSPWTPSYGGWAFQYDGGHTFNIPPGIDLAVTHGPPLGVLDYATSGDYAGCPILFSSIRKARPRVHCYGHIHEAWGAYYGHWASETTTGSQAGASGTAGSTTCGTSATYTNSYHDNYSDSDSDATKPPPQTLESFDPERSRTIENVSSIRLLKDDTAEEVTKKKEKYAKFSSEGCYALDITPEGDAPVERGKQTLFLNAAILDRRYKIAHFPWLVEIDLPRA